MSCCIEVIRVHAATRYGSRSIERHLEAGYVPISEPDPVYGSQWMGISKACACKSSEECAVLRELGMACETHGCGGAA